MTNSTAVPPAAPSGRQLARAYLMAALLVPPRGMKLGWQMPGQPLPVRLLLSVLPAVGPVFGTVSLVQHLLQ